MKKIFLFAMSFSAILLAGCSNEEVNEPQAEATGRLPVNIAMESLGSRVTDTEYELNDEVGLYIVNFNNDAAGSLQAAGNHVDNMKFTKTASAWTPAETIYWKDKNTKADFYCYYPYTAAMSTTAHSFAVKEDQSTEANYKASEFLWGKTAGATPSASPVSILTDRLMSNLIVKVKPGSGFTDETLAATQISVKVCNLKTAATINLAQGTATATGATKEITTLKTTAGYRAMIVPQSITAGQDLLHIFVNGDKYTYKKALTFKANTRHQFSITVSKIKDGIDIGIGGWEEDGTDHGGSAE